MLDPRLPTEEAEPVQTAVDAIRVRLLDTQSTSAVRFSILHRSAIGELREDPIWSWSTAPDRIFDRALHLAAAADADIEIVDRSDVPAVAATLVSLHLESDVGQAPQIVGVVELRVIYSKRIVHAVVLDARGTVSAELPGNLADATGRMLNRLARMCWATVREHLTGDR